MAWALWLEMLLATPQKDATTSQEENRLLNTNSFLRQAANFRKKDVYCIPGIQKHPL